MPCNISLNQPLLEQQSVQEMLSLPNEKADPKVSLENLLSIAQKLIRSELVDCGFDESELMSINLEFAAPGEVNIPEKELNIPASKPLATESEESLDSSQEIVRQPLPISKQFLANLSTRLDEMAASASSNSSPVHLNFNFASSAVSVGRGACTCGGRYAYKSRDPVVCDTGKECVDPDLSPSFLE